MTGTSRSIHTQSAPGEKIALFRSLFRGRDDVYARRFESLRSGKSGYAPVCANEWVRGICEKPRIKCADCPSRRFLSLTDDVVRWHLSGRDDAGQPFVAGVYPMMQDETCFFLAVDFDKTGWQEDATAYLLTCRMFDLPAVLERSRSGRGGHVWIFFQDALPAALARRLGSYLLTETMERRPDVGFDSYDRFFPNQDTMPKGGFGNLIALPLQKEARERGNSLFLDESLDPYVDQWAFLSTITRVPRAHVEIVVSAGERAGRITGLRLPPDEDDEEPWKKPASRRRFAGVVGDLPAGLDLVLSDQTYIPKVSLSPGLRNQLLRTAAFQNPEFYSAQAMRLPIWDKPRIIACAEDHPQHVGLPRGCLEDVLNLLAELKIEPRIRDERNAGSPLDVEFQGVLRSDQETAAEAMLRHDTGVLSATTAFGKTVVAAWMIARRGVSTLVLVHRLQLLDQWVERLSSFLGVPAKRIGQIGGGRNKPNGLLDVALIQSLGRKGVVDDRIANYGHLVVDECHHLPAFSFESIARRARARFVLGLSATVTRKDGHHPIVFMQCGPVRHRVNAREQAALRPFEHAVLVRPTAFQTRRTEEADKRAQFQSLYRELIEDELRNRQICTDILQSLAEGRSPLVLTERNEHLDELERRLSGTVPHLVVLRGGMGRKQRREAAERLVTISPEEPRVLLATGKYIGEGFDDARLDTLMLTLPVSWRGTIAQYAGRLHRLCEGKPEVRVYDYADINVPMLARMFERRCRGYEAIGYTITLPASAVPGWPVDVPLPADAGWKSDFAASVRRLIRDGVDAPLGKLFLLASTSIPAEAEGEARARSATEAFLYRRLESLGETSGRFRLNEELPIAFDGAGRMEVDLFCAEARIAIELDGCQHMQDAAAYRRDRRKDQALQENGYLVLRFLNDDVSRDLDMVLDSILRAMGNRSRARSDGAKGGVAWRMATSTLPNR